MASLDDLKAKFKEAMGLYDNLRTRQATAARAGLSNAWQSQVGGFKRVADAVQTLTSTGSVTDAVKVLWSGSVNGLGIGPLVALGYAGIAGAVALTTSWLTDAYALKRRLDAYDAAIARGASAQEAAAGVARATGDGSNGKDSASGAVGKAADAAKWVAGAIVLAVVAPPLVRAMGGNKAKG